MKYSSGQEERYVHIPQFGETLGAGSWQTSRSQQANALACLWFTSGLDVVLQEGRVRQGEHQRVNELFQKERTRLAPPGSRSILSLCE
jgi:hypothetical protein